MVYADQRADPFTLDLFSYAIRPVGQNSSDQDSLSNSSSDSGRDSFGSSERSSNLSSISSQGTWSMTDWDSIPNRTTSGSYSSTGRDHQPAHLSYYSDSLASPSSRYFDARYGQCTPAPSFDRKPLSYKSDDHYSPADYPSASYQHFRENSSYQASDRFNAPLAQDHFPVTTPDSRFPSRDNVSNGYRNSQEAPRRYTSDAGSTFLPAANASHRADSSSARFRAQSMPEAGSASLYQSDIPNPFNMASRNSDMTLRAAGLSSRENAPTGQRKMGLFKTELCRSYEEKNSCRYGSKCQFAHGHEELRSVSRHPKYKSDVCRTFWLEGACPYGKRCCFIHTNIPGSGAISTTPAYDTSTGPPRSLFAEANQGASRHLPSLDTLHIQTSSRAAPLPAPRDPHSPSAAFATHSRLGSFPGRTQRQSELSMDTLPDVQGRFLANLLSSDDI